MVVSLNEIEVGQMATIHDFPENSVEGLKLLSLGILPGDQVRVTGKAILSGPISLKHSNNTFFALRKTHARKILVKLDR
jgi:Fe2+ transport system protein FeoA